MSHQAIVVLSLQGYRCQGAAEGGVGSVAVYKLLKRVPSGEVLRTDELADRFWKVMLGLWKILISAGPGSARTIESSLVPIPYLATARPCVSFALIPSANVRLDGGGKELNFWNWRAMKV